MLEVDVRSCGVRTFGGAKPVFGFSRAGFALRAKWEFSILWLRRKSRTVVASPGVFYSRLALTCAFITRLLSALPAAIIFLIIFGGFLTMVTEARLVTIRVPICGVGGGLKRVGPWWATVGVGGAAV